MSDIDMEEKLKNFKRSIDTVFEKTPDDSDQMIRAKRTLFGHFATLWNSAEDAQNTDILKQHEDLRPKLSIKVDVKKRKKGLLLKISMLVRLLFTVALICWVSICVLSIGPLRLLDPILRVCGIPNGYLPLDLATYFLFRVVLAGMGVKVTVEQGSTQQWGKSPCGIIIYNHASNLDPFIVNCVTGGIAPKYLGKKSVFSIPLFGWLSLLMGMIPINRGDRQKALEAMNIKAAGVMNKLGRCVAISPEGTRSTDGHLILPFKKGVFHLQDQTEKKFLPIVIHGAFELWPPSQFFTNTGEVKVSILDPVNIQPAKTAEDSSSGTSSKEVTRVKLQSVVANEIKKSPPWCVEPLSWFGVIENAVCLLVCALLSKFFYAYLSFVVGMLGLGVYGICALLVVLTITIHLLVARFM